MKETKKESYLVEEREENESHNRDVKGEIRDTDRFYVFSYCKNFELTINFYLYQRSNKKEEYVTGLTKEKVDLNILGKCFSFQGVSVSQ